MASSARSMSMPRQLGLVIFFLVLVTLTSSALLLWLLRDSFTTSAFQTETLIRETNLAYSLNESVAHQQQQLLGLLRQKDIDEVEKSVKELENAKQMTLQLADRKSVV